jgi:hypothetical protein
MIVIRILVVSYSNPVGYPWISNGVQLVTRPSYELDVPGCSSGNQLARRTLA